MEIIGASQGVSRGTARREPQERREGVADGDWKVPWSRATSERRMIPLVPEAKQFRQLSPYDRVLPRIGHCARPIGVAIAKVSRSVAWTWT